MPTEFQYLRCKSSLDCIISIQLINIHFQDLSIQNCTQIPFNESEIISLKNLPHRSNKGIIYHINGTFSVSNFFIFACKNDVGPHIKGSFDVKDILVGNVCGNTKNQKIKILNIRNSTTDDQNDDENLMDNMPNKENSELWFIIAIAAISTTSILIIGIFIFCFQR